MQSLQEFRRAAAIRRQQESQPARLPRASPAASVGLTSEVTSKEAKIISVFFILNLQKIP